MTLEELQEICYQIQGGLKTSERYGSGSRQNKKGKWYYNLVHIDGVEYMVNMDLKIVEDGVEL